MSAEAMAIVILLLCWVAWIVFLVIHHYAKRKHEAEPAGLCPKDEPTRKQEPRTIGIPDEHAREVLALLDQATNPQHSPVPRGVIRFDLWSLIERIIPETKEGQWMLDTSNPAHPAVKEVLK